MIEEIDGFDAWWEIRHPSSSLDWNAIHLFTEKNSKQGHSMVPIVDFFGGKKRETMHEFL